MLIAGNCGRHAELKAQQETVQGQGNVKFPRPINTIGGCEWFVIHPKSQPSAVAKTAASNKPDDGGDGEVRYTKKK